MKIGVYICIIALMAGFTSAEDEKSDRSYNRVIQMHKSPFSSNNHVDPDKENNLPTERAPRGISRKLSHQRQTQELPPSKKPQKDEKEKTKNWITPSSSSQQKENDTAKPSGWGWLADDSRKHREEKEQAANDQLEGETDDAEWDVNMQSRENNANSDSPRFIHSDYFNSSSMLRKEEKDRADTSKSGDDDRYSPVVERQDIPVIEDPTPNETQQANQPHSSDRGNVTDTGNDKVMFKNTRAILAKYKFDASPPASMKTGSDSSYADTKNTKSFTTATFTPQVIRPAAMENYGMGISAGPTRNMQTTTLNPASSTPGLPGANGADRRTVAIRSFSQQSELGKSHSLLKPTQPIASPYQQRSTGNTKRQGYSLYKSRDEAGMNLLPK